MLQTAMSISNSTSGPVSGQSYQSSHTVPPLPMPINSVTPSVPILQMPSLSTPPLMALHNAPEAGSSNNLATNLVKPSFFIPPPSSSLMAPSAPPSAPVAPPLQPAVSLQRPHGTPLLQPFPPPNPPSSLTPPNYGPVITREKVRDALLVLVQVSLFAWFCLLFCL